MVAHVLRYFPEFRLIKQLVDDGEHGPVLAAHFKRIISRPAWWGPEDLERTGGPAIDLHIHDVDFVQFLFGMPTAVSAQGYIGRGETVEYINTHYHTTFNGHQRRRRLVGATGLSFEHGYDVYFEEATLKYNSSWGQPPQLLTKDGEVCTPALPGEDGFVGELQKRWMRSRRAGRRKR